MPDNFRRDILLAIRSTFDATGADQATRKLRELNQVADDLRRSSRQPADVINTRQAVDGLRQTAREARGATTALADGMRNAARQTDDALERMKLIRRELTSLPSGNTIARDTFRGESGFGRIVTTDNRGITTTDIEDIAKREQKLLQVQRDHARALAEDQRRSDAALRQRYQEQIRQANEVARIRRTLLREEAAEGVRQRNVGFFNQTRNAPGAQILPDVDKFNAATGQLERLQRVINPVTREVVTLNTATRRVTSSTAEFSRIMREQGDALQVAAGKVLLWTAATAAIFGTIRTIRGGIDTFREAEQQTIALARVGRGFTNETQDMAKAQAEIAAGAQLATREILELKIAYGSAGTEAQEAAVTFARLGLSQREVVEATRIALLASNVAGISAGNAAKFLSAAMQQFQLSVSDLPDILNKLNELENTTRVRTEDLLQAISRAGAVYRESGGSLEFLAAQTAAISQATGRSGAEIGNALKTIASRLGSVAVQEQVLARTGVAIRDLEGNLKPVDEIIGELVVSFQNLSDAERASVTTTVAGIRQRNILQSALDQYFLTQSQVVRQLTQTSAAELENAQILETLSTKVEQLVAAMEQFAVSVGDSVVGDALKLFVDALRVTIQTMTGLGPLGLIVVGTFTAYAGSVLAASLSTGALTGTLKALATGFSIVNGALTQNIALTGSQAAAANAAAVATGRQAASVGILSTSLAGARGAVGLLGSSLTLLATPAGAALAALAAIGTTAALLKEPLKDPGGSGSDEQAGLDALQKQERAAQQTKRGIQETIKLAGVAANVLADAEQKRLNGVELSRRELEQVNAAQRAISENTLIDASIRALAAREQLGSNALLREAKRLQDGLNESSDEQRKNLVEQIKNREELLSKIGQQRSAILKTELSGGPEDILGLSLSGDKGFFESTDEALDRLGATSKRAQQELADLQDRLQALDAKKAIESISTPLERAETVLTRIKESVTDGFFLRTGVESDEIGRLKLELEQTKALMEAIGEDRALALADAEAQSREVETLRQKRLELERTIKVREELRDVERRSLIANAKADNRRDDLLEEADFGPDDRRLVRKAAAEVEAVEERIKLLREEGAAKSEIEEQQKRLLQLQIRFDRVVKDGEAIERRRRTQDQARRDERERDLLDEIARFSASSGEESTRGIRQAQALLKAEEANLARLEARREGLRRIAQDSGLTLEQKAEDDLLRQQVEESRNRVEDRALDLTKARLAALREITEERRRQAEQTTRELAGMSDIELARARILAGEIQRGERKPLTQEEFLGLDQQSRQELVKFQGLFPGVKVFEDLDLGFGAEAFSRPLAAVPASHADAVRDVLAPIPAVHREAVREALKDALEERERQDADLLRRRAQDDAAGQPVPPAAAQPGAQVQLNVGVDVDGLRIPLERLNQMLTLTVTEAVQALIDDNLQRGEQNVAALRPRFTRS